MKKVLERIRLLLFAGVYLMGAYSFVRVGMRLSSTTFCFTKLEMAFLLVVHFGLAAALVIAAINRIRAAWRKERPQQQEEDGGDDD